MGAISDFAESVCEAINNFGSGFTSGFKGQLEEWRGESGSTNKDVYKNTTSGAGQSTSNAIGSKEDAKQDSDSTWYNPLGNLRWQGKYAYPKPYIKSKFGAQRSYEYHYATDISVDQGTPIYAPRTGTVAYMQKDNSARGGVVYVWSTAGGGWVCQHMSRVDVAVGDKVKGGQQIGLSGGIPGTTGAGSSQGAHLHLEIHTIQKSGGIPYEYWGKAGRIDAESITWTDTDGTQIAATVRGSGDSAGGFGGNASDNCALSSSLIADTDATIDPTTTPTNHTRETTQWVTDYEDDSAHKAVDRYTIMYSAYDTDTAYDISDICSAVTLHDSVDNDSLQFSATLLINKLDRYFKDFTIRTGDKLSMRNKVTGDLIYYGTIMQTSTAEKGTITITALDNGRLLAQEIITQFSYTPVYDALSTIAYKCGLSMISSPKFESTISGAVKGKGSDAVREALEQVSRENGINYFVRVIGDCLVVKSYADTEIIPYYKPEENIATAPCVLNATEYSKDEDATDCRTAVQVFRADDSGYSDIIYEYQSSGAAKRYGKINTTVEYFDYDTVNAQTKGLINLFKLADPAMTYSLSCAGSDRIVAGCKIRLIINDTAAYFWVTSVEHSYIPNHTVKLELKPYEEPPTLEEMAALYSEKSDEDTDDEDETDADDTDIDDTTDDDSEE